MTCKHCNGKLEIIKGTWIIIEHCLQCKKETVKRRGKEEKKILCPL